MNIDLVKGGWDIQAELADRIAHSQRPADGHVKSASWEDYSILTAGAISCDEMGGTLEVGDFIALHTTPTIGYLEAIGIAVEGAEEGLKLKLKLLKDNTDLNALTWRKSTYDSEVMEFTNEEFSVADFFGSEQAWISGVFETLDDAFIKNTDVIGFEVMAVPENGTVNSMRIVSRFQYRQPARTPAYLECCGSSNRVKIEPTAKNAPKATDSSSE